MTRNSYRAAWLVPLALAACLGSDRGTEEVANRPSAAVDREDDFASRATELVGRYERLGRFSGAVAVSRGSKVLFAGAYGLADRELGTPNTTDTLFDIASLTKQFTAAGILALEAEGKLSVNDRVVAHLPDYPRPEGEKITLHHLLSHRSGIPSLGRLGDGLEAVEPDSEPVPLDRLVGYFRDEELLFEPGERYRYSNSGYVLLAKIIESVSGMTYDNFIRGALFAPLGMTGTGCGIDPAGAKPYRGHPPEIEEASKSHPSWSIGDGCARSNVLDLVRWGDALLSGQLLPGAAREKLFAVHSEIRSGLGYSYGWFVSEILGWPAIHHSGDSEGVASDMYLLPGEALTIVAVANYAPEIGVSAPGALVADLAALYLGEPVELPPAPVELDDEAFESRLGLYAVDEGGELRIDSADGALWVEPALGEGTIFDYGQLEDPTALSRAAGVAAIAVDAALAGNFDAIPLCPPLAEDLAPGELEEEWLATFSGRGDLVEQTQEATGRYPGDSTLIAITHLEFEQGETYFALDLTPALEICGWYSMGREEFEIRRAMASQRRIPLVPLAPDRLLADGFNYREGSVTLTLSTDSEGVERLIVAGEATHEGRRIVSLGRKGGRTLRRSSPSYARDRIGVMGHLKEPGKVSTSAGTVSEPGTPAIAELELDLEGAFSDDGVDLTLIHWILDIEIPLVGRSDRVWKGLEATRSTCWIRN